MGKKLEISKEKKIHKRFKKSDKEDKFEASGIVKVDNYFYVVFDNLRKVAKIHQSIPKKSNKNEWIGKSEEKDSGFEGITYDKHNKRFHILIESKPVGLSYKAQVETYDKDFKFLKTRWLDFEFESANKGFEGIEFLRRNGKNFLLALCEGNKCKAGKKGRKPGGGRIQVFQQESDQWKHKKAIKLPENAVKFEDYSALDVRQNNKIAVVSQASSRLWVGKLKNSKWKRVSGKNKVYRFPENKCGNRVYCNLEGFYWIKSNKFVAVSDKRKEDKQCILCEGKDQSIHLFKIK